MWIGFSLSRDRHLFLWSFFYFHRIRFRFMTGVLVDFYQFAGERNQKRGKTEADERSVVLYILLFFLSTAMRRKWLFSFRGGEKTHFFVPVASQLSAISLSDSDEEIFLD